MHPQIFAHPQAHSGPFHPYAGTDEKAGPGKRLILCNMKKERASVPFLLPACKLQFVALLVRGLGPLVLRGLAKIGAFVPIFDWGSFYFELPQS
jgi:hypothetical protein